MKLNGELYHVVRRGWSPRTAWTFLHWTFVNATFCSAELRAHEYRHVWQWRKTWYLGFAIAYPLEFALRLLIELVSNRSRGLVDRAYHKISWEVDAYDWASRNKTSFTSKRWAA